MFFLRRILLDTLMQILIMLRHLVAEISRFKFDDYYVIRTGAKWPKTFYGLCLRSDRWDGAFRWRALNISVVKTISVVTKRVWVFTYLTMSISPWFTLSGLDSLQNNRNGNDSRDLLTNRARWHHQMETFSTILALCVGNSPRKGQWRGALMFSLMCARTNVWANSPDAGDLGRLRAHYDVILME